MLLTSLDLDPFASGRSLDVTKGDLFQLDLDIDLLVISAYEGFYGGLPGSLIGQLRDQCGIEVGQLRCQLDLRSSDPIRAWISEELASVEPPPKWPTDSRTRFRRLAVIESPKDGYQDQREWPAFNQLFCLLALLPLHGIHCQTVASPLLSAGNHGVDPESLFPALLARCRDRLRHLPDLERLVIFDRNQEAIRRLAAQIDSKAQRSEDYKRNIKLDSSDLDLEPLRKTLANLMVLNDPSISEKDIYELHRQLQSDEITPISLGVHCRRLVENLLRHTFQQSTLSPNDGLRMLAWNRDVDPWIISCLHQVRVFGNWMSHDQTPLPSSQALRREVRREDVVMMLLALCRALEAYPWVRQPKPLRKLSYDGHLKRPQRPFVRY